MKTLQLYFKLIVFSFIVLSCDDSNDNNKINHESSEDFREGIKEGDNEEGGEGNISSNIQKKEKVKIEFNDNNTIKTLAFWLEDNYYRREFEFDENGYVKTYTERYVQSGILKQEVTDIRKNIENGQELYNSDAFMNLPILINNIYSFVDDRDGQKYLVGEYGSQFWYLKNLNYENQYSQIPNKFRNDDLELKTVNQEWGLLYDVDKAENSIDFCPEGFALADVYDWKKLLLFHGYSLKGETSSYTPYDLGDKLHYSFFQMALPGYYRNETFGYGGEIDTTSVLIEAGNRGHYSLNENSYFIELYKTSPSEYVIGDVGFNFGGNGTPRESQGTYGSYRCVCEKEYMKMDLLKLEKKNILINLISEINEGIADESVLTNIDEQLEYHKTIVKELYQIDDEDNDNKLKIGDYHEGGVIFDIWEDEKGNQHGLIVSIQDIGTTGPWINYSLTKEWLGAYKRASGKENTKIIINSAGHEKSVASACSEYSNDGYDDWYLPSSSELSILKENRYTVDEKLSSIDGASKLGNFYWSSNEYSESSAIIGFEYQGKSKIDKNGNASTRAIRSF